MIYSFDPFELDDDLFELRREGVPLKLAPKTFDVLLHLVRHRERVVSKAELLDTLWPGEHVTESVLPANVNAVRRALGDEREQARFVQTVHGRGYRFVAPVTEREKRGATVPAQPDPRERFVGREAVMAELAADLERAIGGGGGLAFLAGEPGIGKTRTAEELARVARMRGVRVAPGRCEEHAGAPAYWPWIQVLRRLVDDFGDDELRAALGAGSRDLAQLVPELRPRVSDVGTSDALDPDDARFRLFDSTAAFLREASRRRPLLLLLDDLHWADEPTLLLLRFAAARLGDAGVLILGTYRDVALRRTHPLARTLGELARVPNFRRVSLRGLDRHDVARFVAAVTGREASAEVVATVSELTEGNPFFLHEMARLLVAEGRLEGPFDASALPQGVREAVGRRLDALDERCNRLLRLASLIGTQFGVQVLETLADEPRAGVLEALEQARDAHLVQSDGLPPGRYAFSHVLVRETLYEELALPERIALHRRVGELLEQLHGPTSAEHAAELALHFFQAAPGGEVARAVRYAALAAERALALLAFEQAVAHYERALQVLPLELPVDEVKRCELLLGLGNAQRAAGRREAALRTLRAAADVARSLGRGDLLARVAATWPPTMGRQMIAWNAEYRPLVEEALAVVAPDALAVRALLTSALVITPPDSDSMQRRDELSREAVDLARRSGDDGALYRALESRLWALVAPERQEERLRVAGEMVDLGERAAAPVLEFHAREHRVRSLLALGRMADADREIEACALRAEALRLPAYHLSVARFRASRALGSGRFDEAEALTEECRRLTERIDEPDVGMMRMLWTVAILFARGGLEQLAPGMEDFVATSERVMGPSARIFAAFVYAQAGHTDDARRHLRAVSDEGFRDLPRNEDWLFILGLAAHACAEIGEREAGSSLYELLEPFANCNVMHLHMRNYLGSCAHFLARLAALLGRDADARRLFEQALAHNQALGGPPFVAATQYEYGRWLRTRHASDRPRAAGLLAAAEATATASGMHGLVARVRALAG